MHINRISKREQARSRLWLAWLSCALMAAGALLSGCATQQGAAQQATATILEAAPVPDNTPVSQQPTTGVLTGTTPTVVTGSTITGTAPATGTVILQPTATPPADPFDLLSIGDFYFSNEVLVKMDRYNLDNQSPEEVLITVSGPGEVFTSPIKSAIAVLGYDADKREWDVVWNGDPLDGKASPLPPKNAQTPLGYNGGLLTGGVEPVFVLRTTTPDGKAHLALWRWMITNRAAEPLKMAGPDGSGESNAVFEADLDLRVIDLDDDGIYEVVADNVSGVQIWKWDTAQARYVPQEGR